MKKDTEPLEPDTYYHVYNRGINGETIFKEERNYAYFLEKYRDYVPKVAETYAYALLGNHFHFLIRTKSENEIMKGLNSKKPIHQTISLQYSHLFNSHTQSINRQSERTGGLFETPFRRKPVKSDAYLSQLICYIHFNPQKHGFCDDFRHYPYSSYTAHLSQKGTRLNRNQVLDWFGGADLYKKFHEVNVDSSKISDLIIEFD